ncbi:MAG TPA: sigma factor [Planctomycetota bacterium]|nr:sigma factor [Planctomycetota bacterium]
MFVEAAVPDGQREQDRARSGDPAALGAVFDRTAAELLHVAVWLCGNRADAEDLLQRTFVQAIEARAQFEPGRPVLPWLCGMLGNHARHLRRERARRLPAREPDGERDPATAASDAASRPRPGQTQARTALARASLLAS